MRVSDQRPHAHVRSVCCCSCSVFLHVIAYRDSDKTSVHRFARHFEEAMLEVRDLLERTKTAKL